MTKEEFYGKWGLPEGKELKKAFMADLDNVIYTVAMEAIEVAEAELNKKRK